MPLFPYSLAISTPIQDYATSSIPIGGTTGAGPTVTVTINGTAVTYTYVAGDTSTALAAQHIAAAVNANATLSALVSATSSSSNVVVTALAANEAGMFPIAVSTTGGATASVAYGLMDLPNSVVPRYSFAWPTDTGSRSFYAGIACGCDPQTKATLRSQGLIF